MVFLFYFKRIKHASLLNPAEIIINKVVFRLCAGHEKVDKKLLATIGPQYFFKLTELMKSDSRAKQSICFERVQILEAMEAKAERILENKECISVSQLDIKGTDIAALGAQGSRIGEVLDELLSMHID